MQKQLLKLQESYQNLCDLEHITPFVLCPKAENLQYAQKKCLDTGFSWQKIGRNEIFKGIWHEVI